jgi:glutamate-1-semialdehyde 2,1-aminomutase
MRGQKLWDKAKSIIPGGNQLLSKRAERFLPDFWPSYYEKAKGCEVWDLDGNRYYDFTGMGVCSCILGYADDDVNEAVIEAVKSGSMCTLNCYEEIELAETLISLHPWAEMIKFARTGGEACTVAVRIARAASGRSKIAFCGYHGWHDWYLAANLGDSANLDGQLLPGLKPLGVPRELTNTAIPFRYNQIEDLEDVARKYGKEIGVIIMEPMRKSFPESDFLHEVRKIADDLNAVLIFDEVTSGFRLVQGGVHLHFEVEPDMAIFGAALATLRKMEECDVQKQIIHHGERISAGWKRIAEKHGLKIQVGGISSLCHLSFEHNDPLQVQTLYAQEMLDRGYLVGAAIATTYAYTDEIIDQFISDSDVVFGTIKEAVDSGDVSQYLKGDVIDFGFKRLT